jgi:outer membrane protein assembly factor BamB
MVFRLKDENLFQDLMIWAVNWIYTTDEMVNSATNRMYLTAPVAYGGQIYILTDDDKLRAISLETGLEIGQWYGPQSSETLRPTGGDNYVPPSGLTSSAEGLYLSLGTNLLYAFETP